MFDRTPIRLWIATGWILTFILMWFVFQFFLLPMDDILAEIDNLEKSVLNQDWAKADKYIKRVKDIWEDKIFKVQITTTDDDIAITSQLINQISSLVKNKEQGSLELTLRLRETIKGLTEIFPAP